MSAETILDRVDPHSLPSAEQIAHSTYCDKCGDYLVPGEPHARHRTCSYCGEPVPWYGPCFQDDARPRQYVCGDCVGFNVVC